jgi:biopolymer transport protein ExbD
MKRFLSGLVVLSLLVGVAAATSGRLSELLPLDFPTTQTTETQSTPQQAGRPAPIIAAPDNQDVSAAIQQVIQRSNDEQVKAIAAKDPTLMADTLTSDHYQELVQVNRDLLDNGVTGIGLVNLEWGAVAVNGSTATATTFETWTTTFADGTTTRARDRNDYSLVLDNGAWKITSDDHPDQSPTGNSPPPQVVPGSPGVPDTQNTSRNWSGYAATGGTYTAVSGTWTVPQFNSADTTFGIDASWIGIGGVRSRDLIQAGTQQTINGNGRTQYQAWVEMLPRASRPVALSVHPGDSVSVSISEQSADQWLIEFTNNTTGQKYQETQTYRSSHSSAEWVEEAPSGGRGVLPLSNFGSIEFSSGSTVKDGQTLSIAAAGARAITMVGSNEQALAVPTALGGDGASFSVARTDAPANTAGPRGRGFLRPPPVPTDGGGG